MGTLGTRTAGSRLAIVLTTVIVTTVVLAGGVALATVGFNSVGSPQIKNGSIQSVDIATGGVKTVDIANGTVSTADLKNNAVRSLDIRDGTITAADIANGQITSPKIADGQVTSADIANGTVTAADLTPNLLRWARVDATATGAIILSGRGATSATRIGTGVYQVTFDSSVTDCGWTATLSDNSDAIGAVAAGLIGIERGSASDPTALWIRTWNSDGTATDRTSFDGFTVQVVC